MWTEIQTIQELEDLLVESPTLFIFKHSTRCSISSVAKNRLESAKPVSQIPIVYIDLIRNRELSNLIASKFAVQHESPQLLVIEDSEVKQVYNHMEITAQSLQHN